jgi:hypothetical protein
MKVEKVHPIHTDKSNGRIVEIRTSKGTITTPCQIVNQNEYNAMVMEGVSSNPLKQIQIETTFDRSRLYNLRKKPKLLDSTLKYWKRRCGSFTLKSCVPLLDPRIVELSEEDLSFIVSMQLDAQMDIAHYPYERISAPRFATKLDMLREENSSEEIMPILDMGESSGVFKAKFRHLVDSGYSSVSLWYQGIVNSRSNLYFVKHMARDLQMWIILSNYRPRYSNKVPASFTHLLPWHGIDSYTKQTAKYHPYPVEEGDESPPQRPIESIRFLGGKTYGILDKDTFKNDHESLKGCPCESLHGSSIDQLLSGDIDHAARCCKVHNLFEGEQLLEEMRTPIRENRLTEFLKQKKYPSHAIQFDSLDDLTP